MFDFSGGRFPGGRDPQQPNNQPSNFYLEMSQPQANLDSTLIDDVVSICTADVEWEESCDKCPLDDLSEYSHVCTECMVHLCQFHVSGHQRHRLTKDHDLIAKTDVIPDTCVNIEVLKGQDFPISKEMIETLAELSQ
jgi:hypothetical protein